MALLWRTYYCVDTVVARLREVVGVVEYEGGLDPFRSWNSSAFIGEFFDFIDDTAALVANDELDPVVSTIVAEGERAASLVGNSDSDVNRFVAEVLFVVCFHGHADLSKE